MRKKTGIHRDTHLSRRWILVNRNSMISSGPASKKINKHGGDIVLLLLLWLLFSAVPLAEEPSAPPFRSFDVVLVSGGGGGAGSMELLIAKLPHSAWWVSIKLTHRQSGERGANAYSLE